MSCRKATKLKSLFIFLVLLFYALLVLLFIFSIFTLYSFWNGYISSSVKQTLSQKQKSIASVLQASHLQDYNQAMQALHTLTQFRKWTLQQSDSLIRSNYNHSLYNGVLVARNLTDIEQGEVVDASMFYTGNETVSNEITLARIREANVADILYRPILETLLINEKQRVIEQILLNFQQQRLSYLYPAAQKVYMDTYQTEQFCQAIQQIPQVYDMRCRPFITETVNHYSSQNYSEKAIFSSPIEYASEQKNGSLVCKPFSDAPSSHQLYSISCLDFPFRSTITSGRVLPQVFSELTQDFYILFGDSYVVLDHRLLNEKGSLRDIADLEFGDHHSKEKDEFLHTMVPLFQEVTSRVENQQKIEVSGYTRNNTELIAIIPPMDSRFISEKGSPYFLYLILFNFDEVSSQITSLTSEIRNVVILILFASVVVVLFVSAIISICLINRLLNRITNPILKMVSKMEILLKEKDLSIFQISPQDFDNTCIQIRSLLHQIADTLHGVTIVKNPEKLRLRNMEIIIELAHTLKIFQNSKNSRAVSYCYNRMGLLYYQENQLPYSHNSFKLALSSRRLSDESQASTHSHNQKFNTILHACFTYNIAVVLFTELRDLILSMYSPLSSDEHESIVVVENKLEEADMCFQKCGYFQDFLIMINVSDTDLQTMKALCMAKRSRDADSICEVLRATDRMKKIRRARYYLSKKIRARRGGIDVLPLSLLKQRVFIALGYAYCAEAYKITRIPVYSTKKYFEQKILLALYSFTQSMKIGALIDMYYWFKAAQGVQLILQSLERKSQAIQRILSMSCPPEQKRRWVVLLQNTSFGMKKRHFKILSHFKEIFKRASNEDFFSHTQFNQRGLRKTFDVITKKQLGVNFEGALRQLEYECSSSEESLVKAIDTLLQEIRMTKLDSVCDIWLFVFTDELKEDSIESLTILGKLEAIVPVVVTVSKRECGSRLGERKDERQAVLGWPSRAVFTLYLELYFERLSYNKECLFGENF